MGLGGIFSKPKVPDPPRLEKAPVLDIEEGVAGKTQRKRKGFSTTILTGDLVPKTTGATLLSGGR